MDALDKIIADRRIEASTLKVRIVALEAELAALELAARLRPSTMASPTFARSTLEVAAKRASGGRRPGDISHTWRGILQGVYDLDMPVDYEMVAEVAKERGTIIALTSVRDRVRNFIKNGLMVEAGNGFIVTQDAVERFRFTNDNAAKQGVADEKADHAEGMIGFKPPSSPATAHD
jgi:hypothetical protein